MQHPHRSWPRLLVVAALALASCAATPRLPAGTCIQRTFDSLDLRQQTGDRQHCLASGTIARRCGQVSAWLAGYGKEFSDLVGPGLFQRRDIAANAAGRKCAGTVEDEAGLPACCGAAGF